MGMPSGVFSYSQSGQLAIAFSDVFEAGGGIMDFGSSTNTITVQCQIMNGSTVIWSGSIQPGSPSAFTMLTYAAGQSLTISMTVFSHSGNISSTAPQIACQLLMK